MIHLLIIACQIVSTLLFIYIIASWITLFSPGFRSNIIYQFLHDMATPILLPFRRLMPPIGMMDLSPILAFLALSAIIAILKGL